MHKSLCSWVLAKGSPEAIGALLASGAKPNDYDVRAAKLAKQGMRVLALAYRRLTDDTQVCNLLMYIVLQCSCCAATCARIVTVVLWFLQ
jgi:magnesium-transporting ATPase (P-type)